MPDQNNPAANANEPVQVDPTATPPFPPAEGGQTYTPPTGPITPTRSGGGKKAILTLLGILFLAGGVIAGVLLVQQQQEIRERAATPEECISNPSVTGSITLNAIEGCPASLTGNKFSGPAPNPSAADGGCLGFSQNRSDITLNAGQSYTPSPACGQCEQIDLTYGGQAFGVYGYGGACGGATTPPGPTAICGDACTTDTDCKDSTYPGVDVVCRGGKCVNKQCSDRGGNTKPGTLCECDKAAGLCGDSCGLAIGLCQSPYTCTYLAQSQCSPSTQYPVCVPVGTEANSRGPMSGVPEYQNASFERRACGASTADPQNNYIYHPAFPSGLTQTQVRDLICNPQPTATAQCLNILAYDTDWTQITDLTTLKAGDTVRFVVKGSATQGAFDKARFTINGTLRTERTQTRPGTTDEFYDEYVVPAAITSFSISAQLHHPTLDWF